MIEFEKQIKLKKGLYLKILFPSGYPKIKLFDIFKDKQTDKKYLAGCVPKTKKIQWWGITIFSLTIIISKYE